MTDKIVKGIMTIDGIAQVDYESLANLPAIDIVPTDKSTNAIQSGAVYSALANKLNKSGATATDTVLQWTGADGSIVRFERMGSPSDGYTFGFYHRATDDKESFYPLLSTNSSGHLINYAKHDHTHNASDILSGTLHSDRLPVLPAAKLETVPISKGGTGAADARAAEYNIHRTMTDSENEVKDSDKVVVKMASPTAANGLFEYQTMSKIWTYIVSKIRSTFGFSSSNVLSIAKGGTNATTAANALNNLGAMPKANFSFDSTSGTLNITL